MKYSEDKVKNIIKLYKEGKTQKEIAELFNTYNTTIRRILKRNEINIRSNSEVQSKVKHNPFKNLDDDETLYWLGYLAADGNVSLNRNRINISSNTDPEHLKKYIKFLNSNVSLNKQLNKKYNCFEYSVNFRSDKVKDYLIQLGITPKKSLTLELLIPLSFPFVRGIIDADGHIRKYSETYSTIEMSTGSFKFAQQLNNFLNSNKIENRIKHQKENVYIVQVTQKVDVIKFVNKLYNQATVYLERKKQNIGSALWKHDVYNLPN